VQRGRIARENAGLASAIFLLEYSRPPVATTSMPQPDMNRAFLTRFACISIAAAASALKTAATSKFVR
jgi:hypothetical protein